MSDELRVRAEGIVDRFNTNPPERPVFVEFAGSPKSGKSTCIEIVGHFFRRLGFRVLAPTEGASKRTPYYLKDDWVAFNIWSASYALQHVVEGKYHSDKYQLAILDRGLFDALAWFELLARDRKIEPKARDLIHRFLLIDNWRAEIDVVFLFRADPKTSIKRETADKLITDPGRAMNLTILKRFNASYSAVMKKYADQFQKVYTIDTSEEKATTPKDTAGEVTSRILELLEGTGS